MEKVQTLIQNINFRGNLSVYETERLSRWYQKVDQNNAGKIYEEIRRVYPEEKVDYGWCIIF